jgi:drug/metabolite transporter (DMT)-like permease
MAMAGATCIAFSAILVRLADVPPSTAAFYRCAYAVPPLALLAWWERRRFGPLERRALWLSLIAGIFFMADLVFWHHAIAAVGAGLATVLGNTQVVIVPLAAWAFLKEKPAGRTLAAVPVVLLGVVLISGVVGAGAYGSNPALGVLFGVLTAITYAASCSSFERAALTCGARRVRSSMRRSRPRWSRCRWARGSASSSSGRPGRSTAGSCCSHFRHRCWAGF